MVTDWTRRSGTVSHPARDDILYMGYGKAGAVFLLARERFVSTLKHRSFQIAHGPDSLCVDHRKAFFDRLRGPAADAQPDPYLSSDNVPE